MSKTIYTVELVQINYIDNFICCFGVYFFVLANLYTLRTFFLKSFSSFCSFLIFLTNVGIEGCFFCCNFKKFPLTFSTALFVRHSSICTFWDQIHSFASNHGFCCLWEQSLNVYYRKKKLESQLASLLNRRVNATAVVFFKNTLSSTLEKNENRLESLWNRKINAGAISFVDVIALRKL